MGETGLNFGPQWLRALSGGHEGGSPPPPHPGSVKYKLADHRYGREEMLALRSHGSKPPTNLDTDEAFFHGKPRDPLSLETMTDDEVALLQFGVNSDAARAAVRPGAAPMGGGGPGVGGGNGEIPGELRGSLGGDRGHRGAIRGARGAIRGRGGSTSVLRGGMRNPSLDDDPEAKRVGPWGNEWSESRFGGGPPNRNRSFERSQSFGERNNWGERNGPPGVVAGPTGDPRRPGLVGPPGRTSNTTENWRQREGAGDDLANDWRHPRGQDKWGTGGSSWRDRAGDEDRRGGYASTRGTWRGPGGRGGPGGPVMRRDREYGEDDEEYEGEEEHYGGGGGGWSRENASRDEGARNEKPRHGGAGDGSQTSPGGTSSATSPPHSPRSKDTDRALSDTSHSTATSHGTNDSTEKHRGNYPMESSQGDTGKREDGSPEPSRKLQPGEGNEGLTNNEVQKQPPGASIVHGDTRSPTSGMNSGDSHHVPTSAYSRVDVPRSMAEHPKPSRSPPTSSYMPRSSPNVSMASQMNAGDSSTAHYGVPGNTVGAPKENSYMSAGGLLGVDHGLLDNSRKNIPSMPHPPEPEMQTSEITWFYRDPSGNVQGPFPNQDMFDWYDRGFFRDHLLVRRSVDEDFMSLGQMKIAIGGNPFARAMQPVKTSIASNVQVAFGPPSDPLAVDPAIISRSVTPRVPTHHHLASSDHVSQVMMPMRGGSGPVGSPGMGPVGSGGSMLMPQMLGGNAPGVGMMPPTQLRAQNQNVPQNRESAADFHPSQSHQQRLPNVAPGSMGPGGRRMPADTGGMNLPQFLASIQMNKDAGSSWKSPGVPPPTNTMSGLSLDERLQSGHPNEQGPGSGLGFLQGLRQQAPIGSQHTNQPPPPMHQGLGQQRMHNSATPVQQLLSNMLGGPQGPSQHMNVPQVSHDPSPDPSSHSLSSLLQKLNMPPPTAPPQHPSQHQQQLPSFLDMGESKDQKHMGGGPFGGHGHPMMPQQHLGQPRGHMSGYQGSGMHMNHGPSPQMVGMPHQQQQPQQQSQQGPNDAFQSLLMQLKQQQPPPQMQQLSVVPPDQITGPYPNACMQPVYPHDPSPVMYQNPYAYQNVQYQPYSRHCPEQIPQEPYAGEYSPPGFYPDGYAPHTHVHPETCRTAGCPMYAQWLEMSARMPDECHFYASCPLRRQYAQQNQYSQLRAQNPTPCQECFPVPYDHPLEGMQRDPIVVNGSPMGLNPRSNEDCGASSMSNCYSNQGSADSCSCSSCCLEDLRRGSGDLEVRSHESSMSAALHQPHSAQSFGTESSCPSYVEDGGARPVSVGLQTSMERSVETTEKGVHVDFSLREYVDAATDPVQQPHLAEEAALGEERRMRDEIDKKAKAVEEERKRLEQERLQWEEECRRKQEKQMEDERKRREEEERLKEARRLEEERLENERRQMAFLQQQRMELEKELERKDAERRKREDEERMQAAMEKKRQEEIQRRAAEAEALRIRLEEEKRERERRAQEAAELKARAANEEAERYKLEELMRQDREEEMEREQERLKGEALRNALLKNATGGVPWGGKGPQQASSTSFLEVQAQEEMERQRRQEQIQQQTEARVTSPPATQRGGRQQQQNDWNSGNVPLRWAATQNRGEPEPKSLAEIQAEEEQKMKQMQTVKIEKKQRPAAAPSSGRAQKESTPAPSAGSSSWASKAASGLPPVPAAAAVAAPVAAPAQSNAKAQNALPSTSSTGFWSTVAKASAQQQQQQQRLLQLQQQQQAVAAAAAAAKANAAAQQNKTKKKTAANDEENVIKLFENQLPKADDDFTKWCYRTLDEMELENSIDIVTFVGFLKDVESPFDVQDYCASYLGTSKGAREFIKEFLERRSKWRNSMKSAKAPEDSMLGPARAINPNALTQGSCHSGGPNGSNQNSDAFHTVKSKGRNKKQKKMQKVDNSLLGFSVTAASDRVNVGDREVIDGM